MPIINIIYTKDDLLKNNKELKDIVENMSGIIDDYNSGIMEDGDLIDYFLGKFQELETVSLKNATILTQFINTDSKKEGLISQIL